MRILFVSRKYGGVVGGVERMSISLMNEMIARGHEVHVLSWDLEGAEAFYKMNDQIIWHKLNLQSPDSKASFTTKMKRVIKARTIIKKIKPDTIIAFQDGAFRSARAYSLGLGISVIAAERNAPSRFDFIKAGKKKSMIFNSFRLAEKITIQCESYKEDYPDYLRSKIVTIPNPVTVRNKFAKPGKDESYTLLSVGRISYQKNYQALIKAFAQINKECPEWTLNVVGGGEQSAEIQNLITQHNLNDKVILTGESDNVEKYYLNSHLFCLPSRWEGFPNALAEAMSYGLPSVGYEECSGVRDLIENEQNGLLADGNGDIETLASALKTLMKDHKRREEMGTYAIASMQPYKPEKIFDQWESFFKSICKV